MLRSLFAIPVTVANTALSASVVLSTSPFTRRFHEPTIKAWSAGILAAAGVDLQVEGTHHLEPDGRYVFVCNHFSLLDVPCLWRAIPTPMRYIAKHSLFKIPGFAGAMRAIGTVDINRNDSSQALRQLQEAERGIGQRCSLMFFAEGTRSRDGRLHPFKKGAFATALSLGVPIVPVAISGTREVLPKGYLDVRPGQVRVAIGAPIPTGKDSPEERERLRDVTHAEVARLLASITPAA